MDWKTDSDFNESEEQPYSSFQSNKSGRFFDRLEIPIILIGAGLLALVILFVLFIPKKNAVTIDDYKFLASRLDQLEKKVDNLTNSDIDVREFNPAENPVQYQQLVNWIKSNAEVITETIKKVDTIEKRLPQATETEPVTSSQSATGKALPVQKAAAAKAPITAPPAVKKEPIQQSKPVTIQPQVKSKPEIKSKPVIAAPETKKQSKPVVEVKPEIRKTDTAKPETVKLIFHRVEKGETLYRISKNYGISVKELQELNDMKKDDLLITVGQELIVKKVKQ